MTSRRAMPAPACHAQRKSRAQSKFLVYLQYATRIFTGSRPTSRNVCYCICMYIFHANGSATLIPKVANQDE